MLQNYTSTFIRKSEALYFGINGQVITFAAQISFFLTDMLEADDITVIYKGAWCKIPCHTCMILQSDLNNMSLKLENIPHRTYYENMKEGIFCVLMLAEISFLPNHPILPIVLVHWYDYYSKRHPI
ncbi:624_t:CDS:2, partial [Rhizophagus irregularis]